MAGSEIERATSCSLKSGLHMIPSLNTTPSLVVEEEVGVLSDSMVLAIS